MTDGLGLFLLVHPNGGRYWRLKYRFDGKEKLLSLGTYPETSIKEARERRDAARSVLNEGRDPGAVKQEQRQAAALNDANAFEFVAREFAEKQSARWTERHANDVSQKRSSLSRSLFMRISCVLPKAARTFQEFFEIFLCMVTACGAPTATLIVRILRDLLPAELVVKAHQFLVDDSYFAGGCNDPRPIAMRPQEIE